MRKPAPGENRPPPPILAGLTFLAFRELKPAPSENRPPPHFREPFKLKFNNLRLKYCNLSLN